MSGSVVDLTYKLASFKAGPRCKFTRPPAGSERLLLVRMLRGIVQCAGRMLPGLSSLLLQSSQIFFVKFWCIQNAVVPKIGVLVDACTVYIPSVRSPDSTKVAYVLGILTTRDGHKNCACKLNYTSRRRKI